MRISLSIRVLFILASVLSYSGLSAQKVWRNHLPKDTIVQFLGHGELSPTGMQRSLDQLRIRYEFSMQDLYATPFKLYHQGQLVNSYYAYKNLIRISPEIISITAHQEPIVKSYSYMHRLDEISYDMWNVLAENYDDESQVTLGNALYSAIEQQEKYSTQVNNEKIEKMIRSANTRDDETKLSMDYAEEKMLVTRRALMTGESFYFSALHDGEWTPLTKDPFLTIIENTESAASIDASGRYVVYTKCMSRAWDAMSGGGCDLWFTTYIDDSTWAPAQKYLGGINTPAYEGLASFSTDGKRLFFSSDRVGGYGGKDIWYSTWDGLRWNIPENAGPTINTAYDEISPYIAEDGVSLFFTSDREGSADIYFNRLSNLLASDTAIRLPEPINSQHHELSCHIISQTGRIVVASNVHGDHRNFDLEIYDLPEEYIPLPKSAISGQVLEVASLKPIYAEYGKSEDFIWTEEDQNFTNKGNGWYFWELDDDEKIDKIVVKDVSSVYSRTKQLPIDQNYRSRTLRWNLVLVKPED